MLRTLDPPIGVRIPASQLLLLYLFARVGGLTMSSDPFVFMRLFAKCLRDPDSKPSSFLVAAICIEGRT